MDNMTIAHRFFYSDFNSHCNYARMSVSYDDNLFYSYATIIGAILKDKNNNNILLLSQNSMSVTTSRHIRNLRQACPFDIIFVPFRYGDYYFSLNTLIDRLIDNIKYYYNEKLTLKYNRENLTLNYSRLKQIYDLIPLKEKQTNKIQETLKEYETIINNLQDDSKIKELKAKIRETEKRKKEELKETLKEYLNKYSYHDLIKFTYSDFYFNDYSLEEYNKQKEIKAQFKKYFNPKNELSFVWFDNDSVKTSQNITVSKRESETLLKLYEHNKIKIGMKIDCYTIIKLDSDFVKIGCHLIPMDNIRALQEYLKNESMGAVA